jgi:hypothetical protein
MTKFKTLAAIALLSIGAGNALGADSYWQDRFSYDIQSEDLYAPGLSLDLFGTYADHERRGGREDRWGGGLGLNFFFTRMLGVGIETHTDRRKLPQEANASVIVRFPSSFGFAPYGFVGGGRDWDIAQYSWHAGGGLELKLNRYTGLFADGRAIFPEDTPDYAYARAGIRIGF